MVGVEPDPGVEILGAIHVGDGNHHEFELDVHEVLLCRVEQV